MDNKTYIINKISNNSGSTGFVASMFRQFEIWNGFPYSYWEDIIESVKDNPLGLYSFIPFAYKMLGIDLLPKFYSFDDINESTRTYIDEAISDNHGLTHIFRSDLSTIEKFGGEMFLNLIEISNKLEKEGSVKVEKLKYYLDGKIYELDRKDLFYECSKSGYEITIKEIINGAKTI